MWVLLAVCAAISQATFDAINKKYLSHNKIDEIVLGFGTFLTTTLFLIPIALCNIPEQLGKNFFYMLPLAGTLDAVAMFFYMKSLKIGKLGEVIPLQITTPLFTLFFAPFLLNEHVTLLEFFGLLIVMLGIYCLNISDLKNNCLLPLKSIVKNKASKYMLITAFLWSISTCLHKIGMQNSNTYFWLVFAKLPSFILFSIILMYQRKFKICANLFAKSGYKFIILGFINAITACFYYYAFYLGIAVYAMIIKRTSAIIGIALGAFLYHEINVKEHMLGAFIMLIGCAFITLN